MAKHKKTIFVCGRYGSGKTTVALNLALLLSQSGEQVNLVDLDIMNPYFRSSDFAPKLEYNNVKLYSPKPNDTTIIDAELLPQVTREMQDKQTYVVVDVGDDDEGTEAMRQLSQSIAPEDCDVLYVVNFIKSATNTVETAAADVTALSASIGFACTGIINNTQAGGSVDAEMLRESETLSAALCEKLQLPLFYHCYNKLSDLQVSEKGMPIEIYVTPSWLES